MIWLVHDVRQNKKSALLVSIEQKAPEWIPYLSLLTLNTRLKVVSYSSQDSPWLYIYEGLPPRPLIRLQFVLYLDERIEKSTSCAT